MTALGRWFLTHGVSRVWMAQKLGVHVTLVSRWATGQRRPSIHLAKRVAKLTEGEVPVTVWGHVEEEEPDAATPAQGHGRDLSATA